MAMALADMKAVHLAMGIFALFVVAVSLVRIMADEEFPPLTATKKVWGRRRGLLLHFLTHVGLPFVVGVIFLTRAAAGPELGAAIRVYDPVPQVHIVQHLLALQDRAANIVSNAANVIETELELYQPWFALSSLDRSAPVVVLSASEIMFRWYQTIP